MNQIFSRSTIKNYQFQHINMTRFFLGGGSERLPLRFSPPPHHPSSYRGSVAVSHVRYYISGVQRHKRLQRQRDVGRNPRPVSEEHYLSSQPSEMREDEHMRGTVLAVRRRQ